MRYIHMWHTPIKVIVFNQPENWYYAPAYNPKLLPVISHSDPTLRAINDLSQWFNNEDGYWS